VSHVRHGGRSRRSWGAVADAVGHCVLVFAFVPPLAALPRWLSFEINNSLNVQDPIVLAFLPVRGMLLLVNAFRAGLVPGVMAGAIEGGLLWAWLARGAASTRAQRIVVGAVTGALAACAVVLVSVVVAAANTGPRTGRDAIAFEIASGVLCGMIAAPTALRFLAPSTNDEAVEHGVAAAPPSEGDSERSG
jgi:hypothetical protein